MQKGISRLCGAAYKNCVVVFGPTGMGHVFTEGVLPSKEEMLGILKARICKVCKHEECSSCGFCDNTVNNGEDLCCDGECAYD